MSTEKIVERSFWTLLSATAMVLAWAGMNISDKVELMSTSVIELNTTMKNVVLQIHENKANLLDTKDSIIELDKRLLILEHK